MIQTRNWSILTAIFLVLFLITMTFFNNPGAAWGFGAMAFICFAFALIRYEEHLLRPKCR